MNLSRRERLIFFVTLAVLGIFFADHYALTPYLDAMDTLSQKKQALVNELRSTKTVFARRRKALPQWNQYVEKGLNGTASQAEGRLLEMLYTSAQKSGLTLTAVKPKRTIEKEELRRVTVLATGTGNLKSVTGFLGLLHGAEIPLRVTSIQMNSRKDGTDDLGLSLQVSTLYFMPQAEAAAGKAKSSSKRRKE